MGTTKIDWANKVWNPVVGCTPVSAGCKNCYAKAVYERFHPGQSFSKVNCIPGRLDDPLHWRKPSTVFVNSMSDIFHMDVSFDFVDRIFARMNSAATKQHTFIILTKRPALMNVYINSYSLQSDGWYHRPDGFIGFGEWPLSNVWLGVSVEDQKTADERIPLLLQTPAAKRIVSVEPMLGEINLEKIRGDRFQWGRMDTLNGVIFDRFNATDAGGEWETRKINNLDWVICGSESGPSARPFNPDWARSLRDQCQAANVPYFLKQMTVDGKLVKMPELDGVVWNQMPEAN